jgi:hypothetical protein
VTRLPLLFAIILAASLHGGCVEPQSGQVSSKALLDSAASVTPRCAEIAAMRPRFDSLGKACEYALSPENLPNFVCQETIQRWARGRRLDTVTAEVTFIKGHDRYSKYTIDGKPAATIESTGGWVSNALFGAQLNAIFRPETAATFEFKRSAKSIAGPADEFAFRFNRSGTKAFSLSGTYPKMAGSILIDRKSGRLMRVEVASTEVNKQLFLKSYKSELNYGNVLIPELGSLLLPVNGEEKVCKDSGICYKNELSFHDCRKFGSEVRIVPNE